MCGICGIFSKSGMPDLKDRVLTMREQLVHRGPDSAGLFVAHDGGLGVRRLSIVDIEGSDQPLYNEDKSIVMVYNGMIYNFKELRAELQAKGHRFTTNGDGEVIIHLFEQEGIRGLGRLNGMFAIALYDLRHSDLFLVRDQIGIKPLYVAEKNGMVCFASEVKAILAADVFSPTLNSRSIELFLAYNYIPGNGTLYKEIVALKQGHYLCRNAKGDITVEQYWAVEDNAAVDAGHSEAEVPGIVERLNGLFAESIERHLIADVEVGCFLSGGLDSSALVHYMEMNPRGRLKTFTVGYDDPSYDERQFARAVTKKYDTEHIEMLCSERDVVNFLEALPRIGDMPIGDQASVSTFLVSKLAHDHVKVCLSGEGGDEIFAGYPTYSANELYPMFDRLPDALLRFLL
ncbi:MAG: asparagine synthase (glutamine-hydrolyzing), partial [Candidatus Omnitrophica bacterium]|nr:asparagine synthase (glutamine-hydrolyzing) [Candidatus Omnitrophota bacterium]